MKYKAEKLFEFEAVLNSSLKKVRMIKYKENKDEICVFFQKEIEKDLLTNESVWKELSIEERKIININLDDIEIYMDKKSFMNRIRYVKKKIELFQFMLKKLEEAYNNFEENKKKDDK